MSSLEVCYWRAFDLLEPLPDRRGDWNLAQIAQLVANVNRDSKRRPEPFRLDEFVLFPLKLRPLDDEPADNGRALSERLLAAFAPLANKPKVH